MANLCKTIIGGFLALALSSGWTQDIPRDPAGFTEHVAALMRKQLGDAQVQVKEPLTLVLGEIQANLDRIFGFCRVNASQCDAQVDAYVKGVAQVYKERNAPPAKEMVRMVVRTSQYLQRASASVANGAGPPQLQPQPLVEGLVALPVLDSPRTVQMLGPKVNEQLGLSATEVVALGLANLRSTLKPLMDEAKVAGKGQIGQLVGDAYHPSRLLLADTWEPLAQAQGGALIVAIPATDVVLYIGEDTPLAIEALRALARKVMGRAPNPLSDLLLRWRPEGWELVKP